MTSFIFSGSFASASVKKNTQDPGFAICSALNRTTLNQLAKINISLPQNVNKILKNEYFYDSVNQTDTYINIVN